MPKPDHIFGVGPLWGLTWLPPVAGVVWVDRAYAPLFRMDFLPLSVRLGVGAVLTLLGSALFVWSVGTLRRHRDAERLCTAGPYAWVRHPLYAAWIWLLGPAIAFFANCWLALVIPLIAAVTLQFTIGREEATLETLFGDAYREYRHHVHSILPRRGLKQSSRSQGL
jgi:protein-S-isoprenylcysteine O-methyltransferase Ste14